LLPHEAALARLEYGDVLGLQGGIILRVDGGMLLNTEEPLQGIERRKTINTNIT
jgi:hypothetical protein